MTEHPKTSHKSPKARKQAKKVDPNKKFDSLLQSETKKRENFLNKKYVEISK